MAGIPETRVELNFGKKGCAGLCPTAFKGELTSDDITVKKAAHAVCAACMAISSEDMCPTVPEIVTHGYDGVRQVIGDICPTRVNLEEAR